ncbi:MAG: hypothetical protein SGARI_003518, partial [Bacillariaceae sp.]
SPGGSQSPGGLQVLVTSILSWFRFESTEVKIERALKNERMAQGQKFEEQRKAFEQKLEEQRNAFDAERKAFEDEIEDLKERVRGLESDVAIIKSVCEDLCESNLQLDETVTEIPTLRGQVAALTLEINGPNGLKKQNGDLRKHVKKLELQYRDLHKSHKKSVQILVGLNKVVMQSEELITEAETVTEMEGQYVDSIYVSNPHLKRQKDPLKQNNPSRRLCHVEWSQSRKARKE